MGICQAAEVCFFASSRTGSHSVRALLGSRYGNNYIPFSKLDIASRMLGDNQNSYFEWGGDHTRAVTIYQLMPDTRGYRSVTSFRHPLTRVGAIYAYTSQLLGVTTSLEGLDDWIRYVFCNKYSQVWRAHGLQVNVFLDELGRPAVDRIYALDRLGDLVNFLVPGSASDLQHLNRSANIYQVSDLKLSTQRLLMNSIAPDLEFWDELAAAGGELCLR